MNGSMQRGGTTARLTEICKLVFYSSLRGVSGRGRAEEGVEEGGGGECKGLVDGSD